MDIATVTTTCSPPASQDEDEVESDTLSDHSCGCRSNGSARSNNAGSMRHMSKSSNNNASMKNSESYVGLDKMIEERKVGGTLKSNIVHFEVPFGKPIEEVYDGVATGEILGSGISGTVRLCTHRATGIKYAVKCLDLGLIDNPESLEQLRQEIYIMCQLDHPNIVRLDEVYESNNEIYLVQELCSGGELFDRLDDQPDYHYTEEQCALLVKQMLASVRYLHAKGIVHRDLKLENFLFSTKHPDSELKMIDFGLSKHFAVGEVLHEAVGTPYTVAPEVIRGGYDEKCDVWAVGVITFLLLSGDAPFGGCGGPEPLYIVRSNILEGNFKFEPPEIWDNVTNEAKEFINSLLVTDPKNRYSVQEAQKSKWFTDSCRNSSKNKAQLLNPNIVSAIISFKEYSDMRKLLCEVLSFTLIPDQIQDLRKQFEIIDTDGCGEITLEQLKKVLLESAGLGNLGGLTEDEIKDIFNAMRVRKSTTTIQWREFIAAGLSQCKVDDRNLQLAFDRIDSDHKGYITLQDVMDLLGCGGVENGVETIQTMFEESLTTCNSKNQRITYEDFLLLMKGQTKEVLKTTGKEIQRKKSHFLPQYEPVDIDELDDGPLMMDDDDLEDLPPLSMDDDDDSIEDQKKNDTDDDDDDSMDISRLSCDLRHIVIAETKHENEDKSSLGKVLNDDTKSPLVVNRCLYRAHRNLRLAVLEASKRFEEMHQERTLAMAKQQQREKTPKVKSSSFTGGAGAGLVLRRGLCAEEDSEDIKRFLSKMKESKEEQEVRLAKAQRQAGRGRRNRTKVVSDLAGMMGSPPRDQSFAAPSKSSRVVSSGDDNAECVNNAVTNNESSHSDQMLHHSLSGPKLGAICEKEELDL